MSKQILLTGHQGFLGSHLALYLGSRGFTVKSLSSDVLEFGQIANEITDFEQVDLVIHLAAISSVADSEANVAKTLNVNVSGTQNLLEALFRHRFDGQVVFASTGQVYQGVNQSTPYAEGCIVSPPNLYSRSKLLAEEICHGYSRFADFSVTVLRLFNHTHKDQSDNMFLPSVHRQLLQIRAGEAAELKVGNVEVERDISSVQEFCRKMELVCETSPEGKFAIYNLCGGVPRKLKDLIYSLAQALEVDVRLVSDPSRIRPHDPMVVFGDGRKFNATFDRSKVAVETNDKLIQSYLEDFSQWYMTKSNKETKP